MMAQATHKMQTGKRGTECVLAASLPGSRPASVALNAINRTDQRIVFKEVEHQP